MTRIIETTPWLEMLSVYDLVDATGRRAHSQTPCHPVLKMLRRDQHSS